MLRKNICTFIICKYGLKATISSLHRVHGSLTWKPYTIPIHGIDPITYRSCPLTCLQILPPSSDHQYSPQSQLLVVRFPRPAPLILLPLSLRIQRLSHIRIVLFFSRIPLLIRELSSVHVRSGAVLTDMTWLSTFVACLDWHVRSTMCITSSTVFADVAWLSAFVASFERHVRSAIG